MAGLTRPPTEAEAPGPLAGVLKVATLLFFLGCLFTLALGIAPNFDTRVVGIGEWIWPGYGADLRQDPVAPECDLAALETQIAACPGNEPPPVAEGADP